MKNLFVILFVFCFSTLSFKAIGQTVNDIPLKDIDVEYVEIVGTVKFMSSKVKIDIDFGQHDKYWNQKDKRIVDENGKNVILNSMVDALNFMTKHGYEYIDAYAVTENNQNVYHYLLRRK